MTTKRVVTLDEIYAQPSVWTACLKTLAESDFCARLQAFPQSDVEWLFVGCGSSYYLAQAAAASFATILKIRARAVPASEILLFPQIALGSADSGYILPVLISRSGSTSEIIQVARLLREKQMRFVGLTCDGNELAKRADLTLQLPVHEHSTVMTSSFTSMLMAMQYVAAKLAGREDLLNEIAKLPHAVDELLKRFGPAVERFAQRQFDDFVFLGQGALFGVAQESALKVTESSCSYGQSFHTLEFRHGPKSIVAPEVAIGFLISESGCAEEVEVVKEMKSLGATTFVIANRSTADLREASDLLIDLELDVPEILRTIAFAVWGQLLGSYVGLRKGLDPDTPKNLSRVVLLEA